MWADSISRSQISCSSSIDSGGPTGWTSPPPPCCGGCTSDGHLEGEPMTDPRAQLADVLGHKYVLERELGHGGMASVYLARAEGRPERVAIKVMNPHIADA